MDNLPVLIEEKTEYSKNDIFKYNINYVFLQENMAKKLPKSW